MFQSVVSLYRAIDNPEVQGGRLVYNGVYSETLNSAIEACKLLGSAFGDFEHLRVGRYDIEFEYRLPSSEAGKFFQDVKSFVLGSSALSKGTVPKNVFIISENWSDHDDSKPESIIKLYRICRFIELLSLLSVGCDKESNADYYSLFFALPPDGARPPRSFVLPTIVKFEMLAHEIQHLNLLEEILNKKNENKAHLSERKLMLRLSIADVLDRFENESDMFFVLVREWKFVLAQYRTNLQTYVYGFSFEKVRREVAQAEIDYGTKLSGVLGDIAGKLLALPVSLAALVVMHKTDSGFEAFTIFIGLVLVSVVLFLILFNQKLQVDRLMHSFDVVFSEFKDKVDTYPKKMQDLLGITIGQVKRQGEVLDNTFLILQFASGAPAYLGFLVLVYKYADVIFSSAKWVFLSAYHLLSNWLA